MPGPQKLSLQTPAGTDALSHAEEQSVGIEDYGSASSPSERLSDRLSGVSQGQGAQKERPLIASGATRKQTKLMQTAKTGLVKQEHKRTGVMREWLHRKIKQNIKGIKNELWKYIKNKRNSEMKCMPITNWEK